MSAGIRCMGEEGDVERYIMQYVHITCAYMCVCLHV